MTLRRKSQTVTKEEFPKLLLRLYKKLYPEETLLSANMQAGFKACGLYPFDPQHPLKRLPDYQPDVTSVQENLSQAVIEVLQELHCVNAPIVRQTKKKVNVTPGKSISLRNLQDPNKDSALEEPAQKTSHANIEDIEVDEESGDETDEEMELQEESDIEALPEFVGRPETDKFYGVQFKVKHMVHHYVGKVISIDDLNDNTIEFAFL